MEVRSGIHAITTKFWGRDLSLYLILGDEPILIDTGSCGMPQTLILPFISKLGLRPKDLSFVINTHAHIDHAGGNGEISSFCSPVNILAHQLDIPWIVNHKKQYDELYSQWEKLVSLPQDFKKEFLKLSGEEVPVTRPLEEGERINASSQFELEVIHTPGHSPGSISLYEKKNKILFSGEAILWKGMVFSEGVTKSPPYYRNITDYRGTLEKIKTFPIDILCTSHFGILRTNQVSTHIEESIDFLIDLQEYLINTLQGAKEPLTLQEITRRISQKRENFEYGMEALSVVSAHLEELANNRIVEKRTKHDDSYWRLL